MSLYSICEGLIIISAAVKMNMGQKLAHIRKNVLKKTQLDMSDEFGFDITDIDKYENGGLFSGFDGLDRYISIIRELANMEDVPLTDSQVGNFENNLYGWHSGVTYSDIEEAKAESEKMAFCIKWSLDTNLQTLFDLFCIKYHLILGDKETADALIEALHKKEEGFTEEQKYWFIRYLGFRAHSDWLYKDAVVLYLKAGEIQDYYNNFGDDYYHTYNIGNCLAEMDYSYLAIQQFEKIKVKEIDKLSDDTDLAVHRHLAISYSKIGRINEAVKMLESCLERVIGTKKKDKVAVGHVYFELGIVYQDAGDYDRALENYDLSFAYFNKKSESYLQSLCYKAILLRLYGKYDEAKKCIDNGFKIATQDTVWYEWLSAIKHSMALGEESSRQYVEDTAIPKLMKNGNHLLVIHFCNWLSSYYEENQEYKLALEFKHKSSKIYEKLMKGDLS